jgi:hypothetical protein
MDTTYADATLHERFPAVRIRVFKTGHEATKEADRLYQGNDRDLVAITSYIVEGKINDSPST